MLTICISMHAYILRDVTLCLSESETASKSFLMVTFLYFQSLFSSLSASPCHGVYAQTACFRISNTARNSLVCP